MTDRVPDLLVDIQTVQGGFFGNRGIRRYALGFAGALLARGVVRALLLNPSRPWLEEFPSKIRNAIELSWATRRKLRELTDGGAAAYVMTSPFEKASPIDLTVPPVVFESGTPVIVVLYDLIPEIVNVYPPSVMPTYWARRRLLKEADLVLTLSEHVRRDAVRRLEIPVERTAVIGAAVSESFRPRVPGEQPLDVLAELVPRITRPFVLSVTGWQPHKNVEALIEAWARLPRAVRRRYQLVLTCPLPPGADSVWSELAQGFGLGRDEVVVTGHVEDRALLALYQQAELFVLPSYEEGFGLPVLEAARCGCPAITSRTSSLPEVLEWEPATFPPEDVRLVAASIERGLLDPVFRADLRAVGDAAARRHTWDGVAERTIRACAHIPLARRPRRPSPARIALVGRFTPSTTPSGSAADRVAALLPPHCRVDRFDTVVAPRGRAELRASAARPGDGSYPLRALGRVRDPWEYDAIVYVVDADPAPEVLDLAKAHPGVIWLVDQPADPFVATELARTALAIVRPPHLAPLAVDSGPFGRAVPIVAASEDASADARAILESVALPGSPVTPSAR